MKQSIAEVIRGIAKEEGVSEQQVLDEMQKAIDAGYDSKDPAVRKYWAAMPFQGKPTPEEFIAYMAGQLQTKTFH